MLTRIRFKQKEGEEPPDAEKIINKFERVGCKATFLTEGILPCDNYDEPFRMRLDLLIEEPISQKGKELIGQLNGIVNP